MLVRAWNPRTGMLIGWLPNHNMAMGFELVDKKKALRFDPNEALTITWIKQDRGESDPSGDLQLSPNAREIEGQEWLPAQRDPNVVKIKKALFVINQIILDSVSYSRAAKVQSHSCPDSKRGAESFTDSCVSTN